MKGEYRIVRSYRRIGMDWLVQQGSWKVRTSNLTGRERRVFQYVWEREFSSRGAAEAFIAAERLRAAGGPADQGTPAMPWQAEHTAR